MGRPFPRRRHVPHRERSGGTVSITWRLHWDQGGLTPDERDLMLGILAFSSGVQCGILAAVVMNDHVHVLARPHGGETARSLVQRWKSISSRRIIRQNGRSAPVWQAEYFERWMQSPEQTARCARYVLRNPFRRWPQLTEYRWLLDNSAAP